MNFLWILFTIAITSVDGKAAISEANVPWFPYQTVRLSPYGNPYTAYNPVAKFSMADPERRFIEIVGNHLGGFRIITNINQIKNDVSHLEENMEVIIGEIIGQRETLQRMEEKIDSNAASLEKILANTNAACPGESMDIAGICLRYIANPAATFTVAQTTCMAFGGQLAIPTATWNTNNFATEFMAAYPQATGASMWIGAQVNAAGVVENLNGVPIAATIIPRDGLNPNAPISATVANNGATFATNVGNIVAQSYICQF